MQLHLSLHVAATVVKIILGLHTTVSAQTSAYDVTSFNGSSAYTMSGYAVDGAAPTDIDLCVSANGHKAVDLPSSSGLAFVQ
jgi:hypothetical protein